MVHFYPACKFRLNKRLIINKYMSAINKSKWQSDRGYSSSLIPQFISLYAWHWPLSCCWWSDELFCSQDPEHLASQSNDILTAIVQGMRKEEPRLVINIKTDINQCLGVLSLVYGSYLSRFVDHNVLLIKIISKSSLNWREQDSCIPYTGGQCKPIFVCPFLGCSSLVS